MCCAAQEGFWRISLVGRSQVSSVSEGSFGKQQNELCENLVRLGGNRAAGREAGRSQNSGGPGPSPAWRGLGHGGWSVMGQSQKRAPSWKSTAGPGGVVVTDLCPASPPGTVSTSHHSSSYKSKSSSNVTSTSGHSSGSSSGAVTYRQHRPAPHFQQQQPLNLSQVSAPQLSRPLPPPLCCREGGSGGPRPTS